VECEARMVCEGDVEKVRCLAILVARMKIDRGAQGHWV